MHKSKNDHIEKTAKVIFKNSRNTINTYSRTYSGASQVYTKSLILRLKQNLPSDEYYEVNGRVKRDLSIETDVCILRGYYKKRRNRFINRGTVSTRSKYSVNRTEIDTIDEFKYDSSACGDSKESVKPKTHVNVNLTSLVVQNLKKLLNDWVKKYLLDNDATKEKIETVLDSILHKLNLQSKETVSSCTYTVDIEVIDQKQSPIPHPKSQTARQGSVSVPLGDKCLRIFSTLSVPKNINRPKTSKCSWTKLNKIRHKKILLSTNGSSKYLLTSSSLNFLTLPTKFLTKRCATYQQDIPKKNKEQQKSPPEELYDVENLDSFAYITRNSTLDKIPSIYKNIYKNQGRNEIQVPQANNLSKKNENQQDNSEPLVSIDFLNQRYVKSNNIIMQKEVQSRHLMKPSVGKKTKKITRRCKKGTSRLRKHKSIKSKQFTYFLRKSKNQNQQEKELLYHFQSIFKIISSHKDGKDIKLDIHINVFPSIDNKVGKDAIKDGENSYSPILTNVTTPSNPKIFNENLVSHNHKIIPLLDGALSQAKYMLSGDTSRQSSDNNPIERPAIKYPAKDLQIVQEISELKMIIKSLANTTEKLVNEHLSDRSKNKVISNNEGVEKAKQSIGVQFSNKFLRDNVADSGIKLKKDPKKKQREYNPRLMKRSTSYKIIDSESLLTVTDMTSAVQGEICINKRIDKAVTCSLPKTKSLFEVSMEKCDEKLLAFRCDDFTKPKEYIYNVCELNKLHSPNPTKNTGQHLKPPCDEIKTKPEQTLEYSETVVSIERDDENSDSIYIDIEPKTNGKKLTIRPHTGITCCEGCLYCICLWIPVLAILLLFHEYVLKDYLPEKISLRRLIWSDRDNINESYFRLTLADLGF